MSKKLPFFSKLTLLALAACIFYIFLNKATAVDRHYGSYEIDVVRVIDGDTLSAVVHIYPKHSVQTNIRLRGVNAPETKANTECEKTAAMAAKAALEQFTHTAGCTINDVSPDKFGGRFDADLTCDGLDIAKALLAQGHVREYDGGKREPWCEHD
jgi:endonuclease YncB( thermonuclease family)